MNKTYSRLARKEYKENLRKTYLYGLLTVLLVIGLLVFGIPVLIKIAIFLGNLKSAYTPIQKESLLAPAAPRFNPPFEATNSAQISLEGYSDPEVFIEIFQNGVNKGKVLAAADGSFQTTDFILESGKNEIYATATNKDDVISQPSEKLVIILDNTPPEITITEPQENTSIYKPDGKIQIKGGVNEEVDLTINDRLVILDNSNKFVYPATLNDGSNNFKVIATDKAGNRTEKEFSLMRE
jgi:hypothetical protein